MIHVRHGVWWWWEGEGEGGARARGLLVCVVGVACARWGRSCVCVSNER